MTKTPFHNGIWSKAEHEKYLEAMDPFISWAYVAEHVGTRSPTQCRSHNQKIQTKMRKAKKHGSLPRASRMEHRLPTLTEMANGFLSTPMKQAISPPPSSPISPNGVVFGPITSTWSNFTADASHLIEEVEFKDPFTEEDDALNDFPVIPDEVLNDLLDSFDGGDSLSE